MSRYYFDIEANDLLENVSKVWCICAVDLDTGQEFSWGPDEISEALEFLADADVLVGHNVIRYDFPALKKVCGWNPQKPKRLDTLLLARLHSPDIGKSDDALIEKGKFPRKLKGRDSLEAWGLRVGIHKADYQGGFEAWSQDMQDYCLQDCLTGKALWEHLSPDTMDPRSVDLEHLATTVCWLMEVEGWPFDEKAAGELYTTLVTRSSELETSLVAKFGSWEEVDRIFIPKRDNKRLGYKAGVEVTKYKTVTFNPGSRQHIIKKLMEAGWKPEVFTDKGTPKLDEDTLEGLDVPEAKDLVEYLLVQKRLGQLGDGSKAWLKAVKNGKVHASYNTMGTVTGRCSHFDPNIAQVPKVGSPYGAECRALFKVPEGWKLVGADFEGLELRCLAHYMAAFDKGAYASIVVDGDVHWTHTNAMGLISGPKDEESLLHKILRNGSKTFTYGDLYGCGNLKAGKIVFGIISAVSAAALTAAADELRKRFFGSVTDIKDGHLAKAGERLKKQFLAYFPARAKLQKRVALAAKDKGWLKGLDGRRVPVRSSHAALNTLLQSAGAVLCKTWFVDVYQTLIEAGYRWGWDGDFVIVGFIHDELQIAVREGLEDVIGPLVVQVARNTGPKYGFNCRLDSKYVVGLNWRDTH